MPQPLPAIRGPDFGPELQAFRQGKEDFLAQQKRNLMQEAGGLAAAGNMKGAMGKLYSGGEFAEARGVSGEMRADSQEARAIQAHARAMDNDKLAKFGKTQELLGNMGQAILKHSNPAQALEQAKSVLKARGLNADSITIDQLPMLMQQNIGVQQAIQNEMQERQMALQAQQADRAQFNTDRNFLANRQDAGLAQSNADRTFQAGRDDAANLLGFRNAQIGVLEAKAKAAAAKASAPKPLTEGQGTARNFLGMMEQAENTLGNKGKGVLPSPEAESPMSHTTNSLVLTAPSGISGALPSWMGGMNKRERQFMQSAMQFIRAKLRKESGATISPQEFLDEYKNLFPQPGDDAGTRRQKAAARKQAMEGLRIQGGYDAPGAPDAAGTPSAADLSDDELGALFQ